MIYQLLLGSSCYVLVGLGVVCAIGRVLLYLLVFPGPAKSSTSADLAKKKALSPPKGLRVVVLAHSRAR